MKPTAFLAAALLASAPAAMASTWSLDSCIAYARIHNISVRSAALNSRSAELAVTEARDGFLPTLNAGASQQFAFGRGLTSENTYANRNTSSFGWQVNLSVPLFQGLSATRRLKYQQANLRTLIEREKATADDVELNVITRYLQALYCGELLTVADEQLRMSKLERERRKAMVEAGKLPELDLTQAESQVAQDELAVVNARNNREMALIDLAQLLELPSADGFDIEPVDGEAAPLVRPEQTYATALANNHSLRAGQLAVDASERNISLARTGWIPRLSLSAGLGSSQYHLNGEANPSFSEQMRRNFNQSVGLTLSVPLFDAFSTRNQVRRAQLERLNAELELDDARLRIYQTIQQAYHQATGAEEKRRASLTAREATREAMLAMQEKYNYGRATTTEWEQAKADWVKAASEAIQAKYEWLLRLRILDFYNRTY